MDLDSRRSLAHAVEQSRQVGLLWQTVLGSSNDLAMELLQGYDEAKAEQVAQMETDVDRFEDELGTYLVKLSSRQLSGKDSEILEHDFTLHRGFWREFPTMPAT